MAAEPGLLDRGLAQGGRAVFSPYKFSFLEEPVRLRLAGRPLLVERPVVVDPEGAIPDRDPRGLERRLDQLVHREMETDARAFGKSRTLSLGNHPRPASSGDSPRFATKPTAFALWE